MRCRAAIAANSPDLRLELTYDTSRSPTGRCAGSRSSAMISSTT